MRPKSKVNYRVPTGQFGYNFRYADRMELGYARVSTVKQDLDRQIDALRREDIDADRIYVDKKSGATVDRPGLRAVMEYARDGDVIVVHTLDRLGRTVRDTLNLIHELSERGIGIRNLADPIRIDSTNPDDPMSQLAVVLLALFGQMGTHLHPRASRTRPSRSHCEGAPSRTPLSGGPRQTGLRHAPEGQRAHHCRDRHQDRHHPHHPLPAPPAPAGGAVDRWARDCGRVHPGDLNPQRNWNPLSQQPKGESCARRSRPEQLIRVASPVTLCT